MLNVLVLRICVTSQGHCDTQQLSASSQDFFFFFRNQPETEQDRRQCIADPYKINGRKATTASWEISFHYL